MPDIMQKIRKNIDIITKFLPLLSFVVPILLLYSLYPKSFEGDPTWEGTWQGRFFYAFFLWLVSLEEILNWEELKVNKLNKWKSLRTVAFVMTLLLPMIYVIVANYLGLNVAIVDFAKQNNIHWANLVPLAVEYIVFATLFSLMIFLEYGTKGIADFSVSAIFLVVVGALYSIDDIYPYGRFTPFQLFVQTTTTLGASILNLMGYQTSIFVIQDPYYGYLPDLTAWDPANPGLRRAEFGIAWPCAGVESLLIYTVAILLFLKKINIRWWQKIICFIIGALVTYFINAFRIASIFNIKINGGDWLRFHNIYGPLYSIVWIVSYPLILIGIQTLWKKTRTERLAPRP